jgi:hypothetical protein
MFSILGTILGTDRWPSELSTSSIKTFRVMTPNVMEMTREWLSCFRLMDV